MKRRPHWRKFALLVFEIVLFFLIVGFVWWLQS